ncbi:MAG: hypothetical protein Q9226_005431, partial [Calogaya cf. arnoldii]
VMDRVMVDRKDAYRYLNDVKGNVDKAVELAKANQLLQPTGAPPSAATRNPPDAQLAYLANQCMTSYPGPRNTPSNTGIQYHIELFRAGILNDDLAMIERTRSQILYQVWIIELANQYRKILNLNKILVIKN